ncbi:hypothetical protein P775_12335 [Puniceibacterium antarcticum]|uniref:Uncharacterized protein n=1 Tax=Puniceibacterium antarcticum TaxID=1206336 RepID=A0A2G8RE70_9RHOB|nr:hypothetical protein P775_12335 [Puniceibacterium antarcticum]
MSGSALSVLRRIRDGQQRPFHATGAQGVSLQTRIGVPMVKELCLDAETR